MKKAILTLAVFALTTATISTSYGQNPDKKSVKTSENIQGTPKGAISEYQNFKQESEVKIKSLDNRIGDLKVYFYQNKIKNKEAFQNNLNLLEQKNDDLKKKLVNNVQDQNNFTSFKLEFNHDMDEIGKSLKDFIISNK